MLYNLPDIVEKAIGSKQQVAVIHVINKILNSITHSPFRDDHIVHINLVIN